MKETKQAPASPEARDAVREVMAAFEAFKGANDARLDEIERKAAADVLLEEKVARIDQAVAAAQARLDRAMSQNRRPVIGGERAEPASAPEAKAAWDGYLKTGQSVGLETKAGLSTGATSGGYVVPYETERAIERRLMTEVGCAAVDRRPDGARRRGRRADPGLDGAGETLWRQLGGRGRGAGRRALARRHPEGGRDGPVVRDDAAAGGLYGGDAGRGFRGRRRGARAGAPMGRGLRLGPARRNRPGLTIMPAPALCAGRCMD